MGRWDRVDARSPLDTNHPLVKGLRAAWVVAPGYAHEMHLIDLVGGSRLSRASGTLSWKTRDATRTIDYSAASMSAVNGSRLAFPSGSAMSVSLWMKMNNNGNLYAMASCFNAYQGWALANNYGTLLFDLYNGAAQRLQQAADITTSLACIVGTYDKVTMRLYVNGVEVNSVYNPSIAWSTGSADLTYIGHSDLWGAGSDLSGQVGACLVHDRALSALEVADLHRLHHMGQYVPMRRASGILNGPSFLPAWAAHANQVIGPGAVMVA